MKIGNGVESQRERSHPAVPARRMTADDAFQGTDRDVSRRRVLQASGATALALAGGAGLSACGPAAAAGAAEAGGAEAFNPAMWDWLAGIGKAIGATLIEDAFSKGLSGLFSSWTKNVNSTVSDRTQKGPFDYTYNDYWVHHVPPVVLVGVTQKDANPLTDKLLACVSTGHDAVLFEPWAWQALSMFVNELTSGKTGTDLAGFQALCVLSLIPSGTTPKSGTSPQGSVAWMTYQTHNGIVEISQELQADGSYSATVKANGIPDAQGKPTLKQYTLPTEVAST